VGDRECPNCEEDTLIEEGLNNWKCLKCDQVFSESDLDGDEEEEV
jgi:ribosomal protein L37AE/L43A